MDASEDMDLDKPQHTTHIGSTVCGYEKQQLVYGLMQLIDFKLNVNTTAIFNQF